MNRLREIRRAKDITQETLADVAAVEQTTISDLERGKNKNPSWRTVALIARALKADPFYLFPVDRDGAA